MLDRKQYMVMDIVHGGVNLSKDEVKVIDHPLFQRLRYISQNDVLSMVFPGATHTRFEHSIGACHMVGRFFDSVVFKGFDSELRMQVFETGYLRRCVRLAVLLHDVGHGAFSHQLEKSPEIQNILQSKSHFEKMWSGVDSDVLNIIYNETPKHIEHEHYSVLIAYYILNSIKDLDVDPLDVIAIMETTSDDLIYAVSDNFILSANKAWSNIVCNTDDKPTCKYKSAQFIRMFLRGLLTNELDADKADYMLRDGQYSSVSYGNYNIDTLIENIACVYESDKKWMGMGIVRKGLAAFEDFTYSRYQLYRQIYSHKASLMFDIILREAISEVMKDKVVCDDVNKALIDVDNFGLMTDHYFWEAFRRKSREDKNSYSYMLINRKKLKFISRIENLPESSIEKVKNEIVSLRNLNNNSKVFHYTTRAKFSAINDSFEKIKIICRDNGKLSIRKFSEETDFFNKFESITITNFYIED